MSHKSSCSYRVPKSCSYRVFSLQEFEQNELRSNAAAVIIALISMKNKEKETKKESWFETVA